MNGLICFFIFAATSTVSIDSETKPIEPQVNESISIQEFQALQKQCETLKQENEKLKRENDVLKDNLDSLIIQITRLRNDTETLLAGFLQVKDIKTVHRYIRTLLLHGRRNDDS